MPHPHRRHRSVAGLVGAAILAVVVLVASALPALAGPEDAGNPEEGTWLVPVLLGGAVIVGLALVALMLSRRGKGDPPRR